MFYVTLTTIFEKQDRCAFVLNHLLTNQTRQPEKVLLHLSEEPYLLDKGFANKQITHPQLNQVLEKFSDRIEIRWVKNIGPYRKLIYTMKDLWESESLMITIDDDFVYNKNLFENLLNDYEREQCSINYRGFTSNVTSFETMNQFRYQVFRKIIHNRSVYNFSTNGAGTVFSSSMFKEVKDLFFREDIFMKHCSTGDDIWYNLMRVLAKKDLYIRNFQWDDRSFLDMRTSLYERYNKFNDNNSLLWRNTFNRLRFIMED